MTTRLLTACALTLLLSRFACAQTDPWNSLMVQGNVLDRTGEYAKAAILYREAERLAESSHDPRLAFAINAVANTDQELGNFAQAEREYRHALAVAASTGKFTRPYALTLDNLGVHYMEAGQRKQAEDLLRKALDIHLKIEPPDSEEVALARNALANLIVDDGRYAEAETLVEAAIATFRKHPTGTGQQAVGLNNLGVVRMQQRRYTEATELFEEATRIAEAELGPDHPTVLRALSNLGTVYGRIGRLDEADHAFQRSVAIAENRLGKAHPVYARVLLNYAGFLRLAGRKHEAKNLEARAHTVLRDNARTNGRGMTVDVSSFRR